MASPRARAGAARQDLAALVVDVHLAQDGSTRSCARSPVVGAASPRVCECRVQIPNKRHCNWGLPGWTYGTSLGAAGRQHFHPAPLANPEGLPAGSAITRNAMGVLPRSRRPADDIPGKSRWQGGCSCCDGAVNDPRLSEVDALTLQNERRRQDEDE